MRHAILALTLFALACADKDAPDDDSGTDDSAAEVDADGDGSLSGEDCDDNDNTVFPGADEICDGLDNDCDGLTDDADDDVIGGTLYYSDTDSDGYGDDSSTTTACQQPPDTSVQGGDCDDSAPNVNPGAVEECDDIDNDCDNLVDDDDDDVTGGNTWCADDDGDGYGDPATESTTCVVPSNGVRDCTDCDDSRATTAPGAEELCDNLDNDCDGYRDDEDPEGVADGATWYADADGDGYGDALTTTTACDVPTGYTDDNTDCDDTDSGISPGALEVCDDEVDDDCDGVADDGCSVWIDWYGWRVREMGFGGYGQRDCELYWESVGSSPASVSCPECDIAVDVTYNIDPSVSYVGASCFSSTSDFSRGVGFDADYYGYGYPAIWYNYYGTWYGYGDLYITYDSAAGTVSWYYGYRDYYVGLGYYFTQYYGEYVQLYQ